VEGLKGFVLVVGSSHLLNEVGEVQDPEASIMAS